MPPRHSLDSFAGPVVADTSVVINLNATGCSEALLAAMPNQVLLAELVVSELEDQRSRQHQDAEMLSKLVDLDLIRGHGPRRKCASGLHPTGRRKRG